MTGSQLAYTVTAALGAVLTATGVLFAVTAQTQDAGPRAMPPARIDWKAVSRDFNYNIEANAQYSRPLRPGQPEVDNTNIPILLPDAASGVSTNGLIFYSLGDVYDINIPQPTPGLTVLLSGNRVFVPVEAGTLSRTKYDTVNIGGADVPVLIEKTEDGWLASFSKYGMSYTAEVTCGSPQAMATCEKPDYVIKLTQSLTTVVLGAKSLRVFLSATEAYNDRDPFGPFTANREVMS